MLYKIKLIISNKLNYSTRRVIKNSYSLILSQLLRYVINIFISIWIVRYLGAELFGAFSYITALTGIFGIFSSLGLQSIIVRELIKKPNESKALLGTSIFLSFITGIIASLALIFIVVFLNHGNKLLLYLAIINSCSFLFDTFKIFSYHYESLVQSDKVAKINNISIIIASILKVICLRFNLGIYVLSSIFILESAISGILLFILFSKNVYSPFKFSIDKMLAKSLLKDALPLIMSGFMISIYMKIDQVMIQNILGNKEAGIFAVSVRLTEIFYFIPVIILSSFFPGIVASKDDTELLRKKMDNLYSILIIFSYSVIFLMTLFSGVIINRLFGDSFIDAKVPLIILIWNLLFVCLGVARNAYILTFNLNKYYMYVTIIGAILNLTCNLILIPKLGIIGAPISTIFSNFVAAYLTSIIFKPLRTEFFAVSKCLICPIVNVNLI